jgi:hypothetical protein
MNILTRASQPARHGVRRPTLVTLAVLLLTGGFTVLTDASASAHTGNLPVTAKCNTTTGEYDFTAKLTLSNVPDNKTGTTKWRIGTSAFEGTPNSDANMNRGPISTTGNATVTLVGTGSGDVKFSLPGTTTGLGPWFYAFTKWSGASAGSDGQLTQSLKGDCKPPATPKDAAASVTVTPATCEAPGTASVKDKKNATLVGTLDQSVGTHIATFKADAGHNFPNGTDTLQVSYPIPGKDKSLCTPKTPTAEALAKVCVDEGKTTGLANVTVTNTADDTNKPATYDVALNGVTKQVTLDDGKSGSVSFDGLGQGQRRHKYFRGLQGPEVRHADRHASDDSSHGHASASTSGEGQGRHVLQVRSEPVRQAPEGRRRSLRVQGQDAQGRGVEEGWQSNGQDQVRRRQPQLQGAQEAHREEVPEEQVVQDAAANAPQHGHVTSAHEARGTCPDSGARRDFDLYRSESGERRVGSYQGDRHRDECSGEESRYEERWPRYR